MAVAATESATAYCDYRTAVQQQQQPQGVEIGLMGWVSYGILSCRAVVTFEMG